MREMLRIAVGMRGMGWECGCGESAWEFGESRWKCERCGESGWRCRESGNLSIAVEMTYNSNGSDKFTERREIELIENEHICKNLISRI